MAQTQHATLWIHAISHWSRKFEVESTHINHDRLCMSKSSLVLGQWSNNHSIWIAVQILRCLGFLWQHSLDELHSVRLVTIPMRRLVFVETHVTWMRSSSQYFLVISIASANARHETSHAFVVVEHVPYFRMFVQTHADRYNKCPNWSAKQKRTNIVCHYYQCNNTHM